MRLDIVFLQNKILSEITKLIFYQINFLHAVHLHYSFVYLLLNMTSYIIFVKKHFNREMSMKKYRTVLGYIILVCKHSKIFYDKPTTFQIGIKQVTYALFYMQQKLNYNKINSISVLQLWTLVLFQSLDTVSLAYQTMQFLYSYTISLRCTSCALTNIKNVVNVKYFNTITHKYFVNSWLKLQNDPRTPSCFISNNILFLISSIKFILLSFIKICVHTPH